MGTVHGVRSVGDNSMQVQEDPSMVVHNSFVTCDSFIVPGPPHPLLPRPGTEIRVSERGWGLCPCCNTHQPQVRGGGVGVIECHASGQFKLYPVTPRVYALSSVAPDET